MQVTIEFTKHGLLFKKPCIELTVQFTDEERATIKKSGLGDTLVYSARPLVSYNPNQTIHTHSLEGVRRIYFRTDAEARDEEPALRAGLRDLKAAIERNVNPDSKKSFTL